MGISNLDKLQKIDQEFSLIIVKAKGRFSGQDHSTQKKAMKLLNELHFMFIGLSNDITAAQNEIGNNQSLGISQSIDAVEAFFEFIKNENEPVNTKKFVMIAAMALNQLIIDIESSKITSTYPERAISALQGVGLSLIAVCKSFFTLYLLISNRNEFKLEIVTNFKPAMDHFKETLTGKKESKKLNALANEIGSLLNECTKPTVKDLMGFFKVNDLIKPEPKASVEKKSNQL